MAMMREVGLLEVGPRWRGIHFGRLRALIPLPVNSDVCLAEAGLRDFADTDDAWDKDFDRLVGIILDVLQNAGPAEVVAPLRQADSPINRVKRWLTFRPSGPLTNRDNLDAPRALCSAARDDSHLRFASVETPGMCVEASDGHPILWIWTSIEDSGWERLTTAIAQHWPTRKLTLDLSGLHPSTHYAEGPTVVDAIGKRVFWTDGVSVLRLEGKFSFSGRDPEEIREPPCVYLPPHDEWKDVAPAWAAGVYTLVLRDLEALPIQVVERIGAKVESVNSAAMGEGFTPPLPI
ncbi:MAG: hypothetical protein IPK82_34220 [Polyangiaceae bacterium]|nr:hypothetical protein [Polyangiaceae bacterium]